MRFLRGDYLDLYEYFLSDYRNSSFNLIEIGIYKGGSIKTWSDYFPLAQTIGVDINDSSPIEKANVKLIKANAVKAELLVPILIEHPPFIFIEDASHLWSHQIKTFETAFPHIISGGFYICEDIQTSFGGYRDKAYADQDYDAASYFSNLSLLVVNECNSGNHPQLQNTKAAQIALAKSIEFMCFIRHCVIIKKK